MSLLKSLVILSIAPAIAMGALLVYGLVRAGGEQQPIKFSHKVHAGDYKIACEYCHSYGRNTAVAGIPSVQRCMGCHKITAADKPEVQKLQNHWNQKQPIRWVRISSMADFVFFEHWPHIRAGVNCQTCHGPIEAMNDISQMKTLSMSDCLACHRKQKASVDCVICHR